MGVDTRSAKTANVVARAHSDCCVSFEIWLKGLFVQGSTGHRFAQLLSDLFIFALKTLVQAKTNIHSTFPVCMCSAFHWLLHFFHRIVGETDRGGAFGPTWIRWIVCLRTASMEWNVPRKYGPHGELFFFLIQREQAIAPNNETFSPFINPGVRVPWFSADVRKKCALIALHVMAEEATGGDGFQVPELGEEWKMGCQNSSMWESEGEVCRKTKVCLQVALGKAMCATIRCTSCMDPVTRSLSSCVIGS